MSKLKLLCGMCTLNVVRCRRLLSRKPSTVDLPPGSMQGKARTGCTVCHDAHILVQQRLSKAAWGKEVDKMMKWGAIVSPSDRDALVEYFSSNFPPDKSPYIAQRSAPSKR